MTIEPQYFSPLPMPKLPSSFPDLRPEAINGELYSGTGAGIIELGKRLGAQGLMKDNGTFSEAMFRAIDKVNGDQKHPQDLVQQAIIDPESVNIEDITIAQAEANLSLNITRTILNRVVQAWKDIINTR